jgi:hypothetical protein
MSKLFLYINSVERIPQFLIGNGNVLKPFVPGINRPVWTKLIVRLQIFKIIFFQLDNFSIKNSVLCSQS